ncbi:Flp pilus assembly complex ATPase component TadA [Kineosporia rhizophila]|uniref:CpaF family protein n=1 Tax=Kineosporia rhizophila TaxID=84633 RepID=UPI001E29C535|nr:ATPase, T2SS/T4P/T4SS family [Kineosporia rhizophila]MCE0538625.1 Flp pilus assembly complex ATPase component TadA [Kineosporia rhizophila]
MTGAVSYALVRELRAQVAQRMTTARSVRAQAGQGELGTGEERQLALALIAEAVRDLAATHVAEGRGAPDGVSDGQLAWAVEAAMFGAGPLQPLLEDEDLENLDLNGYDEVWATYASRGRVRLPPIGDSDQDLIDILRSLASYAGPVARPWSTVHPQLDLGLPGGVRVSGLLAASARPQVSIRRDRLGPQAFLDVPPRRYADAISLVELGTMDRQCAAFLGAAVRARANILIAGATDAGKTTLLRAMANAIPPGERIITIEQARELRLGREAALHADVVELETVLPSADHKGGLDGADLVRRSKRMNPDRLIFGEVLAGAEARAMLEAMLQGGDGSMSTIHSRNAYGAIARLIIGLGSLREPVQPSTAAALIGQAIDFVVYVRHVAGSRRVVTEILEISGHQGESVSYATIFVSPEPGEQPHVSGRVEAPGESYTPARRDTRIPLRRAGLLAQHGYTDELGERLNAEGTRSERRRNRQVPGDRSGSHRLPVPEPERARPWADLTPSAHPVTSASAAGPAEPVEPLGSVHPEGSAFEAPGGHVDPAGIPELLLQDTVSAADPTDPAFLAASFDGLAPGDGFDALAERVTVDGLVRSSLDLPDDGRGGGEPIIHRRRPEPLAPAPVAGQDEAAALNDDDLVSEVHDAPGVLAGPSTRAISPIIDMGARRRSATQASSSAEAPLLVPGENDHYKGTSVATVAADVEEAGAEEATDSSVSGTGWPSAYPTRRGRRARPPAPPHTASVTAPEAAGSGVLDSTASYRDEGRAGEHGPTEPWPAEPASLVAAADLPGHGAQAGPGPDAEDDVPEWKRLGLPRSQR